MFEAVKRLDCVNAHLFPQVGLWYSREVAVILFYQPDEVADAVSIFCRYLIPGLWPMVGF